MGMVLYLRRATESDFQRLKRDADALSEFVIESDSGPEEVVDFDKAWQALHFLLAGEAWGGKQPAAMLLNEYEESEEDLGYGPFWFVPPEVMRDFAAHLEGISDDDLKARYNPEAMDEAKVYLADAFVEEGSEALDYILQGLLDLRRFAATCTAAGDGAIGGIA